MNGQEILDAAFSITPQEREVLRAGKIPHSVRHSLRMLFHRTPAVSSGGLSLILSLLLLPGIALALVALFVGDGRFLTVMMAYVLLVGLGLGRSLGRWRREPKRSTAEPTLRILEGAAESVRTWWYGYGDCYHLWTALKLAGQVEEPFQLFDKLGTHTISGWARVFVAAVPNRNKDQPDREQVVAVEIREDTIFVKREPGRPPPEKPMLAGVPAD